MSFDYTATAATALKLLTKFGQTITLVRTTGNSVDPITGTVTSGSDASVTTTGIIKKFPDDAIDGTRILTGDRQLILSNEQVPTMTDKPTVNSENWSMVGIETLSPAGTDVIYICHVRK